MRYFVTGGTGFLGGHVVRQLRDAGHEVVALARDPSRAGELAARGVRLVKGDITDRASLREPMAGADGVFHLAAWYEVGTDASRAEAINVEGTRNVLETMRELGVPKGVYTSTLAVNSNTHGRVVDESYRHDGPHLSAYDRTKWRAHHEVARPMMEEGLPLVIVMPGVVYGPGDTSQMGGLMRRAGRGRFELMPGGGTGFCWSHVEDIARGHVLAMERGRVGETYMLAGPCRTAREVLGMLPGITGRPLRGVFMAPAVLKASARLMSLVEKVAPVPADLSSEAMRVVAGTTYYGSDAKARNDLGWQARPLEQGLRETFGTEA